MALAVPAAASAAPVNLQLDGANGKVRVLSKIQIRGTVNPPSGSGVTINVYSGKRRLFRKRLRTNPSTGAFGMPHKVRSCCRVRVEAVSNADGARTSRSFRVRVRGIARGSRGPVARLFNRLLRRQGYHAPRGRVFNARTSRAIQAFRKVNRMGSSRRFSRRIFRKLLRGQGAYRLREKRKGKYVEVSLARSVMVLARNGKPRFTYHISHGKPGTRTIRGRFRFHRKEPGFNNVNMYYSVYFHGGYATHGYNSVPNYPASGGCLRNPIPDSKFIYNWINFGTPIWLY